MIAAVVLAGVALFVAFGGGPTVPDVSGRTAADAVSILRSEGYSPQTAGRLSADVARGIVINTTPPAGTEADEGARVVVNVSQGTGNVAVPAPTGLSQAQATAQLTDAGLEARILRAESASAPEGSVTGQDPAAGLQVPSAPPSRSPSAPARVRRRPPRSPRRRRRSRCRTWSVRPPMPPPRRSPSSG